ncbi:LysR family transcriptional regulator [Thalassotalea sp. LPB0316]|uniref:LysR family transcriptional regulator n=1 Tax=Thalassotalea sp. LPB0316 TaxID=2769490 RepID=UPI00186804AB|nr:LysR family transcriptional regulator [Thalassotalea sp. LPB0316]QOL25795.1 LysR family transcriptional regulator [Thalassotalea sp. LPB0316]
MTKKFDLNLLRIFTVVYEQGSVSKAAEQLNLTQSAISNSLKRFREEAGQEVFNRTGRGVKPTRFGQEFYERLRLPLMELESLVESLYQFDEVQQHRFTVYCHEAVHHQLRQNLDCLLANTNIEILLIEIPSDETRIYDDLINEKVDLLIDIIPAKGSLFTSTVIRQDDLCCVVKKGHPRLNEGTMSKSAYLKEQHALFDLTRFDLKFVDLITDEVLPKRKAYSEHKSLLGLVEAVSYSEAVGVVPMSLAKRYQSTFNLVLLPFPFAKRTFDSYMISLTKMKANEANRWLRDMIIKAI